MSKFIFTVILILVGCIGYMYFFGKGEDKSSAQVIVRDSREVAKSIGDFLKHQKNKYDDGEFDHLIEKIENSIHKLKTSSSGNNDEVKNTWKELQVEVNKIDTMKLNEEKRQQLKRIKDELNDGLK